MSLVSIRRASWETRTAPVFVRRLRIHAAMILVVWPLVSLLMAAFSIRELPYYDVSLVQALLGAAAGLVVLAPDLVIVGTLMLAGSTLCFHMLGTVGCLPPPSRWSVATEPVVLFLAAYFGLALWYPSVLAHPVLAFARALPVLPVTVALGVAAVGAAVASARRGRGALVATATCVIGIALPQPVVHGWLRPVIGPGRAPLVVLGLDSLSHADDLGALRALAERYDGSWYSHAVSPGLLTNAVWTSILRLQPVREHGVFHTFQGFPSTPDTLVSRARRAGLRTVSVFPDQITCAVGSQAGFDEDRSGPMGWRQLASSMVENASLLLPVVRPLLPRAVLGSVPPNHAGTFAYDLDRELEGIFAEGDRGGRALVVAHHTYLHIPRFPSYRELTPSERDRVWWTPAAGVHDRSFDWQDQYRDSDPLDLRSWKVRRLTGAVVAAVTRTQFFATSRKGELLLLSDHGDRLGLTPDNFWKPEYHHVPLLTINLPERADLDTPISLLDTASLIGLGPREDQHEPTVEFVVSAPEQWAPLVRSAQLAWDGSVTLDVELLDEIFSRLRAHRPWPVAAAEATRQSEARHRR